MSKPKTLSLDSLAAVFGGLDWASIRGAFSDAHAAGQRAGQQNQDLWNRVPSAPGVASRRIGAYNNGYLQGAGQHLIGRLFGTNTNQ